MWTVLVEVDTNDGDYISETYTFNEEQIVDLKIMCKKLSAYKLRKRQESDHNYWNFARIVDYDSSAFHEELMEASLSEEEVDWLVNMVPIGEYGYAQLESIQFIPGTFEVLL